jgi:hypothetical protein
MPTKVSYQSKKKGKSVAVDVEDNTSAAVDEDFEDDWEDDLPASDPTAECIKRCEMQAPRNAKKCFRCLINVVFSFVPVGMELCFSCVPCFKVGSCTYVFYIQ